MSSQDAHLLLAAVANDFGIDIGFETASKFVSKDWIRANGSPFEGDVIPSMWLNRNYRFFCRRNVVRTVKELAAVSGEQLPYGRLGMPQVDCVLRSMWPDTE
jgi:hypothetical protein